MVTFEEIWERVSLPVRALEDEEIAKKWFDIGQVAKSDVPHVCSNGCSTLYALPENTEELLMALHGEFYGRGLADADAFRILPRVIEKLRLHGEIK